MRLHENRTLFAQAIRATAQQMKIREIYIEKDYFLYTLPILQRKCLLL